MTKFLVDRMLGQTAKWLRLLGIDAEYAPEGKDEEILRLAEEEKRVVITRDRELGREKRAMLVKKDPAEEIIKEVLKRYDVEIKPLTRCSKCNSVVKKIDKEKVEGKVPKKVFQHKVKFWYCPDCDQYYWRGSHWEKIMETIDDMVQD